MTTIYDYQPHPHVELRKAAGPPKPTHHFRFVTTGAGRLNRLNAKVGLRITLIVGTMWCAYLFTGLALVSAPTAFRGNTLVIVGWIAQTFLQLVLLPIIIVGQNVQATASDSRAQATYDDAVAVLEEAQRIQEHLLAQDKIIQQILASTEKLSAAKPGS